jgi:hypothetical protein
MAKPKYRTIHDLAEEELSRSEGSLVRAPSGTVYREGALWDVQKEWRGQELARYTARHSTWWNSTRISLYAAEVKDIALFHVCIDGNGNGSGSDDGKLTEEETKQMAEVYMMALNLRRVE